MFSLNEQKDEIKITIDHIKKTIKSKKNDSP
jgi:hypothetical protein